MIKASFSKKYIYKLPDGHRFPISKYELVKEQLIYEGWLNENQIEDAGLCDEADIFLTHTQDYWRRLRNDQLTRQEIRRIGLPVSQMAVDRASNTSAGTIAAALMALETGLGLNIAGGTHHAYSDRGEGFCILNDVAVAANYLLSRNIVRKLLVIDLDVHQGNGTAAIFAGDDRVFTFSLHGRDNYPIKKEVSDWDIPLPSGTDDNAYLAILNDSLPRLIDKAMPQIIFYIAGVDVLASDALGRLALTKYGCRMRDEITLAACHRMQIPAVVVMGGGYSPKIGDIVEAHCNTFKTAIDMYS